MNRNNHLEAYVSSQSINSDVIITCDAFFFTVDKPTVIVVDQSLFIPVIPFFKIEEWKERGITIFELPPIHPS